MRNPSYDIRIAAANILSGITWNSQLVEIFDELAADEGGFPRIVLLEVTGGGPRDSKCGFGGDWNQLIKITMAWPSTSRATKNVVDLITDEIFQRLVPGDSQMNIGPDFSIWKIEGLDLGNQNYSDGAKNYVDKNIRITYSLTES